MNPVTELFSLFFLVIAHRWTLAFLIAIIVSVVLSMRYRHSKKSSDALSLVQIELIKSEVIKVLPVDPNNGWFLDGMSEGVRVFARQFAIPSNTMHRQILACSTLVDASPRRALLCCLSLATISSWFGYIRGTVDMVTRSLQPLTRLPTSSDSDIIAFSIRTETSSIRRTIVNICKLTIDIFMECLVPKMSNISSERLQRLWSPIGRQYSLIMSPLPPSSIPYDWSMILFSVVPGHKDITMVTLVALPSTSDILLTKNFITFQLCALRDHVLMSEIVPSTSPSPKPKRRHKEPESVTSLLPSGDGVLLKEKVEQFIDQPLESLPPSLDPDYRYIEIGKKCAQDLLTVANATEDNGWTFVGNSKGVSIMKKIPNKGDPPVNCVKGTITINTPPDFVLRILMDPVHAKTLDEMLKDMKLIKDVAPTIDLMHLIFKAVWPTSARDFSVCNVVGRIDKHTSVHAACSVIDSRIPELKGCVRGDVLAGGYCIKDVPGNPNAALVTYVTQVDLKGSVPNFVVNKIIESQPQCVKQLEKLVVDEFSKLNVDSARMEQFEDKFPIYSIYPEKETLTKTEHIPVNGSINSSSNNLPPHITTVAEVIPSTNHDLEDTVTGDNPSIIDDMDNELTPINSLPFLTRHDASPEDLFGEKKIPNIHMASVLDKLPRYRSDEVSISSDQSLRSQLSASTESLLDYPRNDNAVDFRTLSNQISARMLEELFNVSGLDMMDPSTHRDQEGGWKFQGIEKDVAILKKKMPDSPFYSFLGRGLIDLPPQEVFNCVRNPTQRFTYDNMLKELHIVKQIEDGLYVLHLHHEATQCFLKQSRDFCLLVCERSEPNKKMVVGSSVDIPDCPPQHGISRGKIFTSGWVIEPYRSESKLCTQITYTVQVDMGGVPASIVNFVSRRQPLAVSYIRDFLESTSLSFKERSMEQSTSSPRPSHRADESNFMPVRFKI